MGIKIRSYLEDDNTIWGCCTCKSHFATYRALISDGFTGSRGPAYFFSDVTNVSTGRLHLQSMRTGYYDVRNVYCRRCHTRVGWTYVDAKDESESYKVGKYVLEERLIEKVD